MNQLPANLHIIKGRPETLPEKVRAVLGAAPWLSDPKSWNRDEFLEQIDDAMWASHGQGHAIDQHLIGMLISQIEVYVKCWQALQSEGLVCVFNAGQTPGKNPYLAIADKALGRVATRVRQFTPLSEVRPQ
jgi:hypothetical protein